MTPEFSFIVIPGGENYDCNAVLPANSVADISFFVNAEEPFRTGIIKEKTGDVWINPVTYRAGGVWVDLALAGKDLKDILRCGECFRIVLIKTVSDTLISGSNALMYVCDTEYTSVIEYDLFDPAFGWDCPLGVNRVRLPVYLDKPQFIKEQEIYKRRNGTSKVLFSEIGKQYELNVDYMSEEMHEKLIVALSCDNVTIDGKRIRSTEDYSVNWDSTRRESCGRTAPAKARVTEDLTRTNGNCGVCDPQEIECSIEWGNHVDQIESFPTKLTFEFDTDTTIAFKHIFANSSEVDIDFGDGNSYSGFASNIPDVFYFAGTYVVSINADVLEISCRRDEFTKIHFGDSEFRRLLLEDSSLKDITFDNPPYITAVDMGQAFQHCYSLEVVPAGLFDNCHAEDFTECFYYCKSLKTLPEGLFGKCTAAVTFTWCFRGCTALTTLPAGMWDGCTTVKTLNYCFFECTSITTVSPALFRNCVSPDFSDCFSHCESLVSIPEGLFDDCTEAIILDDCFGDCIALTTIPESLFYNCPNVTEFKGCFSGCVSLQDIPDKLFINHPNALSFSGCFSYCYALTAIPDNLFSENVNATSFNSCFDHCKSLETIPGNLFANCINVADFGGCFNYCYSLENVPDNLFSENVNVTSFSNCFHDCYKLQTVPENLFANCPKVTDFGQCFYGSGLISIPPGLFRNNTLAENFTMCFGSNNALITSIPAGLFDNCINVTNFWSCFSYCVELTGNAPELWVKFPTAYGIKCFYNCTKLTNYAEMPENWK